MNTERDELTELIYDKRLTNIGDVTDAILAAGYRKPRTISTVEELDALSVGTIIQTDSNFPFEKWTHGWAQPGREDNATTAIAAGYLPATVLWEPTS